MAEQSLFVTTFLPYFTDFHSNLFMILARLLADLLGAPDLRQELEDRGAARLGVLLHHRYSFDGGASVTGDAA